MRSKSSPSILLAYPSAFYAAGWGTRLELKSSQLLLASYLAQYYPVEFADFEISIGAPNSPSQVRRFQRKVKKYLAESDFDILALSCWASLSYTATLRVARTCRELYPDKPIIVGGYHATACAQDFLLPENLFDYVIIGEGENALKEISAGFPTSGRPSETQIVKSDVFKNEQFVGLNWDIVGDFMQAHYPDGLTNIYLYLSRGCPFGCSFCMEPLKDRSWRAFSPEKSVEEMLVAAERFNSIGVAICDACFGKSSKWRKEFFRRLVDAKPDFWIIVETRHEYLDQEDIELLSKIKSEIQFGLESASPEMLHLMKKCKNPDKYLDKFSQVSSMLSDNGILHRANLIFNHPGETQKSLEETFTFIDKELTRTDRYLMWASAEYMHFPGCEVYSNMDLFKERFGSKFMGGEWWKKEEDQYGASIANEPSADLSGERAQLWNKMFIERDEAMKAALAPTAFKFAAAKYFPDWKNDPRFRQD